MRLFPRCSSSSSDSYRLSSFSFSFPSHSRKRCHHHRCSWVQHSPARKFGLVNSCRRHRAGPLFVLLGPLRCKRYDDTKRTKTTCWTRRRTKTTATATRGARPAGRTLSPTVLLLPLLVLLLLLLLLLIYGIAGFSLSCRLAASFGSDGHPPARPPPAVGRRGCPTTAVLYGVAKMDGDSVFVSSFFSCVYPFGSLPVRCLPVCPDRG